MRVRRTLQREDWRPLVGVGTLLGLGWVLVALNTVRAIHSDASFSSQLVGIAIPAALAVVLFAGAIGITRYGLLDRAPLIAGWTVLGTASVTVAIALNVVGFDSVRPDFSLALFMTVNAAGGGAVLGFVIGLYDAHQHRADDGWRAESDRSSALAQRLSVVNRVLRHDIRTQAQIVTGATGQFDPQSDAQERTVERLEQASDRLSELSTEAREMESLLGGAQLEREVVDLPALVRTAGAEVQTANPTFTVEYDLPDEQAVYACPLLDRAVKHLLVNAVEHNDSERPHARVRIETSESPAHPVHLTVADNGPGLPDHERPAEDGYRESQLRHSSGVGLWFVKWIVDDSGGTMTVETDAETGTRVTLELPKPPG